jgi:crossover junction endodeoxyribonuclease RuvC
MSAPIYSGVDPGKNGAIASVDAAGEIIRITRFRDAETEGRIGLVIADHFAALPRIYPVARYHACSIERVGAMPRQGLSSTFTFGRVYGEALSAILLSNARMSLVRPQTWQRDLALPKREEYAAHKRAIKEAAESRWSRRFVLAEVDALWIAEHARRFGAWRFTTEGTDE